MKVKIKKIVFSNVICLTEICKKNDWQRLAAEMRNLVIQNDLYSTAPLFFSFKELNENLEQVETSIYLPVNETVEFEDSMPLKFYPEIFIDEALVFRIADLDSPIEEAYAILEVCAEQKNFEIQKPFYHVYLNVYGEGMMDVIAPIKRK